MVDAYSTGTINGWKYQIADVGKSLVTVSYSKDKDSYLATVTVKVTPKHRVFMQTCLNNEADPDDSEYSVDPDTLREAENLIRDAKDLLNLKTPEDIDITDLNYEVMCFVGRVLIDFSNVTVNTDLEEILKL